jgi:hypothetical protein
MDEVAISGELPAGRFAFEPARPHPAGGLATTTYRFDGVAARDVEFVLDEIRLYVSGSEFEDCLFRQDPKVTKANRGEYHYSYGMGSFGWERRSTYRNCAFDHVDFGSKGGGYVPGDARFEGCTFRRCAFREFDARTADFVGCAFVGTISSAWFHGENAFAGNDLSGAKLRRVEFRRLDLRDSRLPDGPEYVRVDDFLAKARQARTVMAAWPDEERERAESTLRLAEERWSEPYFRWRAPGILGDSPLWPLLESLTV